MLACVAASAGYAPAGPLLHARSSSLAIPQSLPARVPRVSRMIAAAEGALEVSGTTSAVATRRRGLPWLMRMVSRSILIWQSVFVQLIKVALVKRRFATRGERDPDLVAARRRLAAELRDTLIRLGPTFVKVGQLLSTRVDVFAPEGTQRAADRATTARSAARRG